MEYSKVENITPQIAHEYLAHKIQNMNKELIKQYQTFRNTNAVQSIEIVTSAGRSSIANRPMINKIIDFIINELRKEEMYEESRKDNL